MRFKQMIRVFKHQNKNRYLIKVMDSISCNIISREGYKGYPVELLESFSTENPISDYQKILEQFKHCKCSRVSEWYKFNPIQYFNLEYELSKIEGNPLKPSIPAMALIAFGTFIFSMTISSSIVTWTSNNSMNSNQTLEIFSFKQLE